MQPSSYHLCPPDGSGDIPLKHSQIWPVLETFSGAFGELRCKLDKKYSNYYLSVFIEISLPDIKTPEAGIA